MNSHGNRARLGGVLVAVAAALALVALPGLASGRGGHDGDSAPAGTISSFDRETGVLTIDLADGGSNSGFVTRRTHVRCDNGRHRGGHGLRQHRRGRGASASRRGELEPGDDRSEGVEPGEDNHEAGDDDRGARGLEPGDDDARRCGVGDLSEGATVRFAVLVLVDGQAAYKVISLPKPDPEAAPSE